MFAHYVDDLRHRAGEMLTFWLDATTVHISSGGRLLKTVPSRLSDRDVAFARMTWSP